MSSKHTPTPWTFNDYEEDFGDITAKGREQAIAEICDRAGQSYTNKDCANGRLIVASVNSYAAHCKDPVAAAESDLLGRMRVALEACLESFGYFHSHRRVGGHAAHPDGSIKCACDLARALLAETKEGT